MGVAYSVTWDRFIKNKIENLSDQLICKEKESRYTCSSIVASVSECSYNLNTLKIDPISFVTP